jgi:ribosomal protein S6
VPKRYRVLEVKGLNRKEVLKIPLGRVAEGADLCLENASQFCSDARTLAEKSSCEHALGLSIFAMEELGKAIMLKEKAAYANRDAEDSVCFEKVIPDKVFNVPFKNLKKRGFSGCEINPFYDHRSKLLYTRNIRRLATYATIIKSIDGKGFSTEDEMNETIERLWKKAVELNVEKVALRELAFYVDYDQKRGEWNSWSVNLTQAKVKELTTIIEEAISLIRQWKI